MTSRLLNKNIYRNSCFVVLDELTPQLRKQTDLDAKTYKLKKFQSELGVICSLQEFSFHADSSY